MNEAPTDQRLTRPPAIVFGVLLDETLMAWPGRNQLMAAMAKHTQVILLQKSAGARPLSRPRRPRLERLDGDLWVARDAFNLTTRRGSRRLGNLAPMADGYQLRSALAEFGVRSWLLWLTVPDPRLSHGVPDERLVYDCMDPNFLPDHEAEFNRNEFALANRARVVFASARVLHERMRKVNANAYLLPNAAPVPTTAALVSLPRPAGLENRAGPIVGYLGTIDWRFDAETMTQTARALPDITFAIVGRINKDQMAKVAALRQLPNVVMPGQVSIEDGEAYVSAFDVGLIPFTPTAMNDAINPVKMHMYLAYGKPVVSTWIAECRANPWVTATSTPAEFAAAIQRLVTTLDTGAAERRREQALRNTWEHRARSAIQVLAQHNLWDTHS
jgi:glycosyltransferase involved in cell wall biosynthesis